MDGSRFTTRRSFAKLVGLAGTGAVAGRLAGAEPAGAASAAAASWSLTGNGGTKPANDFVGTTDAKPLRFATHNVERMRITQTGGVGVNVTTPSAQLHVQNDAETAILGATHTDAGYGVAGTNGANTENAVAVFGGVPDIGSGVLGSAGGGFGVSGTAVKGIGVFGTASDALGVGVRGTGVSDGTGVMGNVPDSGVGVLGVAGNGTGVSGSAGNGTGVAGSAAGGTGVAGSATTGTGVLGKATKSLGVAVAGAGAASGIGVLGTVPSTGYGVKGAAGSGFGVYGSATTGGVGVGGANVADDSIAVQGVASGSGGIAVQGLGQGTGSTGVNGQAPDGGIGVSGSTPGQGYGLYGSVAGAGIGVYGTAGTGGLAARFDGTVAVNSNLVMGDGSEVAQTSMTATSVGTPTLNCDTLNGAHKHFRIDHPLDPANKFLVHSCVEAPERLCLYTGRAVLGANGHARVELPSYFDALNEAPLVQLTGVGAHAVHLVEEVRDRAFVIGGAAGQVVHWQVSGVRHDAASVARPLVVELDKGAERGNYVAPELHGAPHGRRVGTRTTRA